MFVFRGGGERCCLVPLRSNILLKGETKRERERGREREREATGGSRWKLKMESSRLDFTGSVLPRSSLLDVYSACMLLTAHTGEGVT